jgi:predicted nucleic acid-binding protein
MSEAVSRAFVDTSAWYAIQDADDGHHAAATAALRRLVDERAALYTTELVVGETYTLLRTRCGFGAAARFLDVATTSPRLETIPLAEIDVAATFALLRRYADHHFSFVDAASFVAMKARRLKHAFAFDRHFTVAGFRLI